VNELARARLRIAVICHDDDPIGRDVLPKWAATFADVVAIVAIRERREVLLRRFRSEMRRVGPLRMLDVLGFRLYYRACIASSDAAWQKRTVAALQSRFRASLSGVAVAVVDDPNTDAAYAALRDASPDLVIVRCRWLLNRRIYALPRLGTFVLHPGICPEFRNAHGCFWALVTGDLQRVGMTLLKVDEGIDTGPVYGYFSYPFDECSESHVRIQDRMLTENLDDIREALEAVAAGRLDPINVTGRRSQNWGQPWLSAYLRWKREAWRRKT
jgi:folate-dependent phosphoribosylglycinamide formyltransferase PurN